MSTAGGSSATSVVASIKQLDQELYKIERQVFKTIKQEKLPLEEILDWIRFPPSALRTQFAEITRVLAKTLTDVSSVDELFFILPPFWNSFNPSLLEHFVNMLEDESLQKRMQGYLDNLCHFRNQTTLGDFLDKWVGDIPPNYREFVMELGESWREKTVEDLEKFRIRVSRQKLFGSGHMPIMITTKSSSILVVYALPQTLFPINFRQKALHDFLRDEDVLKVVVDGECVLDLANLVCLPCSTAM